MYTEFEFIEQFLVKYAKKFPGARNLKDDAAVFLPKANKETVVSTDTYIAGVHGPSSLNPSDAVRRAILIAASDLAAMAADPECIFLSINLPKINSNQFLEDIAKGIGYGLQDTKLFLAGGNLCVYEGCLSLNVTVLGSVPKGSAVGRNGALPGDLLFVSGNIGDGYLGLKALKGELENIEKDYQDDLISSFLSPVPRLKIAKELRGIASSMIDLSDSLVADVGHICNESNCSVNINSSLLPFSCVAKDLLEKGTVSKRELLLSGDDYELAFSLPKKKLGILNKIPYKKRNILSLIGEFSKGSGVLVDKKMISGGYKHF